MTLPSPRETLLALRDQTPLVHCITNYVAMNSTANLLLAAGETRIFTFAPVYRNRERGRLHVPEFTMLVLNISRYSSGCACAKPR